MHPVNLNIVKSGDDPITTAILVAMELDCLYDAGVPFRFLPQNREEHAKLLAMMDEYGLVAGAGRELAPLKDEKK